MTFKIRRSGGAKGAWHFFRCYGAEKIYEKWSEPNGMLGERLQAFRKGLG